ncbi:MAG TPA: hypothetical protein VJT49_16725 [Amycolatopsis sp.]|uniref:hypothetical protein n=1 Tax=Amycolatopsis sp. TaxID=37632 RepID=UPI002B4A784E|nr:hypothetical protein [Amycolatopsis sp.]HKS46719.1 hypothetical protein [Amycolatopsis sp.]
MITLPAKIKRAIISFSALTCVAITSAVLARAYQVSSYIVCAMIVVCLSCVALLVTRGVKRWLTTQIRTECERAHLIRYLDAIKTTDDLPCSFRSLDR